MTAGEKSVIAVREARRELADLHMQAEAVRATLVSLRENVSELESFLRSHASTNIVQANEQLVFATLKAQSDAETAARVLSRVSRSAEIDELTQLPNRVLLIDRLDRAIVSAKRRHHHLALMFVDLDNFKHINDTLGHACGDEALKLVARRITAAIREADTVSRHGGDEFLVLLNDVTTAADAGRIAAKILAAIGAYATVGPHEIQLMASVGIGIYPEDGESVQALIDHADAAMYRAKRYEHNSFVFYGAELSARERDVARTAARTPTVSERELTEQGQLYAELREANEKLVLAVLESQDVAKSGNGKV